MFLGSLARASAVRRPCLLVTGARGFGTETSEKTTFIGKAKAYGANALLGMYTHRGDRFDKCLGNLKIEKISDGSCVCTLPVEDHVQNAYKTLHGGAICTIVDVVGTLALLSVDPTKPGVSVDLNCNQLHGHLGGFGPEGEMYMAPDELEKYLAYHAPWSLD